MTTIQAVNQPDKVWCNLVCFHHVGGNGNSFRFLIKLAQSNGIKLYLAALPGRNGRNSQQLLTSVDDMVQSFGENIISISDELNDRPTVFFGHSLGAIIAFELARRDFGFDLSKLIISAAKSPDELSRVNKRHDSTTFLHLKSDSYLMDYIQSIGGLPKEIDPMFLQMTMPTIKRDYQAFETYCYELDAANCRKVTCPIVFFIGTKDTAVSFDSVWGWEGMINGHVEVRKFDNGSHFYFTEGDCKDDFLTRIIRECNMSMLSTILPSSHKH